MTRGLHPPVPATAAAAQACFSGDSCLGSLLFLQTLRRAPAPTQPSTQGSWGAGLCLAAAWGRAGSWLRREPSCSEEAGAAGAAGAWGDSDHPACPRESNREARDQSRLSPQPIRTIQEARGSLIPHRQG